MTLTPDSMCPVCGRPKPEADLLCGPCKQREGPRILAFLAVLVGIGFLMLMTALLSYRHWEWPRWASATMAVFGLGVLYYSLKVLIHRSEWSHRRGR